MSLKRTTNIFGTSLKKNYEKMLKKVYESNQFELIMIFWELKPHSYSKSFIISCKGRK